MICSTRSCAINMLSFSLSNLDDRLVKTPIGYGSLFSSSVDGNKYVIHTQAEMGYDQFQLCRWFNMKIKLWIGAHFNHFYFH
jgi:hypothetical protein